MRIMSPRDVAAAFLAWMDCVARTIGGGVESLRRLPRVRLIEEADAFRLKIPARGNSGPVDFDFFKSTMAELSVATANKSLRRSEAVEPN